MSVFWVKLLRIPGDFWKVVGEMSPFLLLGFALAGVLFVLISARTVQRHLGGRGIWPVFKAALFGVPLPLCSCGVIPVGAALHRQGASRGATVAFLISTPQTGVDSILVTLSLLGVTFAVYRPVAALVSGVLGGILIARFAGRGKAAASAGGHEAHADHRGQHHGHGGESCCAANDDERPRGLWPRIQAAATYGFVTLPEDIGRSMLGGLLVAAVITAVMPEHFFAGVLSGGPLAMLAMMALGIPVYVCATASVPVAAALIARGVSPGVALVFLMTGPATNAATIATIWRTMGPRTAVLYLLSVAGTAMASGLLLDYVFTATGAAHPHAMGWMLPPWVGNILAVVLLAVLVVGALRASLPGRKHAVSPKDVALMGAEPVVELKVAGMTCNHCRAAVEQALSAVPGSDSVVVDLRAGRAVIAGTASEQELIQAVQALGYKAETIAAGPGPRRG